MSKIFYLARFWIKDGQQTECSDKLLFSSREKALAFLEEKVLQWSRAGIFPHFQTHPDYPDTWIVGSTLYQIQEFALIA